MRINTFFRGLILLSFAAQPLPAENCVGSLKLLAAPAKGTGMGSVYRPDGTTSFRVWAPNATGVGVVGSFNKWDQKKPLVLKSEGNGHFSAEVSGAKPGDQYKYVVTTKDGKTLLKTDPRAERIVGDQDRAEIVDDNSYEWKTENFKNPLLDDLVIYEMHIGSFAVKKGNEIGTWKDAAEKLEDLRDMGYSAVEVMPIAEFSGDKSWGYNLSYPHALENAYGTPNDFKAFVDKANALGIAVGVDVVYNHWDGGRNWAGLYRYDGEAYDGGKGGGIYFYADPQRRETPWGQRPDYGRPEVRDFIRDDVRKYFEKYRVTFLRVDSTCSMRLHEWRDNISDGWRSMQDISEQADQDGKFVIAEDLMSNSWVTKPRNQGGAGFHSQWDKGRNGGFYWQLLDEMTKANDQDRNLNAIAGAITHNLNGDPMQRVILSEDHNEVSANNGNARFPERIAPGHADDDYFAQKRSTLFAGLVLTSPGIPMLFQGQDMYETGAWKADPMDWTRTKRFAGIRHLYKDLIHLRRNLDGDTEGLKGRHVNVFHLNNDSKVLAFHRWNGGGPGDDVIVIVNLSNQPFAAYHIGLPRDGMWKTRFNSDWKGYSQLFNDTYSGDVEAGAAPQDGMPFSGDVNLGPYSMVVLSQDR